MGKILQCVYGCSDERGESGDGVRFQEKGREWRLPGHMYADDFVLYGEVKEDMNVMLGYFVEVCRRRGLEVNADKSKAMVLGRKEGLECEVCVDVIQLEYILEFKCLGCVLDELGTDEV